MSEETHPVSEVAISAWLVANLAETLEISSEEIDLQQPFSEYGLSSVEAVSLTGDLENWLQRKLSPTLAWEYPSIEALARHLAEAQTAASQETEAPAAPGPENAAEVQESMVTNEPVAIIGIGCRFPGANSHQELWELLVNGVDAIREVPADRWDGRSYYDPDPAEPGKMNTRWGGFLDKIDEFDARFFGIHPREAERMDPQQRLLLECAYEALEDAGLVLERLAGEPVGVYVGISGNEYGHLQLSDLEAIDAYAGTGNALSIAANRISYVFDLHGPSLAIDTACSSSLVAVHLACQCLWNGEASLALVGGSNLILSPAVTINFSKAGAMAADGRCKAFDTRADGYVRSEGAAMVVLKPLSKALADGDPVYATILASAVNQDGRSNGLMAPNPNAQEAVLRTAYHRAGISPGQVQYIEAHGTGTFLGDPIEAQALGAVVGRGRLAGDDCRIGSIKTNLGHMEAAAGVAGLIKVVLSLHHGMLPPSLHFQTANPHIDFAALHLKVQTQLEPWPSEPGARLSGVSSFGFGGTNAHVILQDHHPVRGAARPDSFKTSETPPVLLPLSARSPAALSDIAAAYQSFLADGDANLTDICFTASLRRSHHVHRLAVSGCSRQEIARLLQAYNEGERPARLHTRVVGRSQPPKLVFVFPGQGAQWAGMGRQLLASEPVFREMLEACDRLIRAEAGWSVLDELAAGNESTRGDDISVLQPTLFALQAGLAALWQHWGIQPGAVVGHSMGEVAAAFVAGALSLPDAVRTICRRSELLKRTSGQGAMLAVGLSLAEAEGRIRGYADRACIAVSNSLNSTVLSGDPEALQELSGMLAAENIFCRHVKVDVAAHSPQVEPLVPELVAALENLAPQPAGIPIYSTVIGGPLNGDPLDSAYWGRNLRQTVLFAPATERLLRDGYNVFLELSPHPILLPAIHEQFGALNVSGLALPSMRRSEDERAVLLDSLGSLFTVGVTPRWPALYPEGGRHVALPTYAWQRQSYWLADENEGALSPRLEALPAQAPESRNTGSEERPEDWLYELAWEPLDQAEVTVGAPQAFGRAGIQTSGWLILADHQGFGLALAGELEKRGAHCTLAFAGENYGAATGAAAPSAGASDVGNYRLDPARPADFQRFLDEALSPGQPPCAGIVHLWSLDAPSTSALESHPLPESGALLEAAQRLGPGSALYLIQELSARFEGCSDPAPKVWWVTRGSQAVLGPDSLAVAQAPLWGLARTAAVEHPDHWGGLVDLDPQAPDGEAGRLCDQILRPDGEDQLAWRGGQRYVARLKRYREALEARDVPIRSEAVYLITGGLGGLGLEVARWLVEQGARRLMLTSRRGLPARHEWDSVEASTPLAAQIAAMRELESLGAKVEIVSADVADEAQMGALMNRFRQDKALPLAGVLHLAGLVDTLALSQLDLPVLSDQLRAKVAGSWLVYRLTQGFSLDFLVLFSSASSILGSPFLGGYAAANAFLDSLALYLQSQGAPARSINWGFWSQVGMVARYERLAGKGLVPNGMRAFAPEQGMLVLQRLLKQQAQAVVLPVDWLAYTSHNPFAGQSPLLEGLLVDQRQAAAGTPVGKPRSPATTGLQRPPVHTPAGNRIAAIQTGPLTSGALEIYLRQSIARALHLEAQEVSLEQHFTELGLDSLMAMELIRKLEHDLHIRLYPREIFEQPTVRALAAYLATQHERTTDGLPVNPAVQIDPVMEARVPIPLPVPLPSPFDARVLGYGAPVDTSPVSLRLPGIAFLLSSPRSGSTLLRVMLAGHSRLFCPPELHLLPFRDLSVRSQALGATYLDEGLQRALMELLSLTAGQSQALLDEWAGQNLTIQEVYAKLQDLAGRRLLVDKTPSYAANLETLERAEVLFAESKYIFLVRHPYAVIESFVRNRLDKLVGAGESDPFFLAEQNWALSNANVLDFLAQVPKARYRVVRFEDLVKDPAAVSQDLCKFLAIPFEPAILKPYEGERMTDGIHPVSMGTGDPNFLTHDRIDARLGESWRDIRLPRRLGGLARRVAAELQYELPNDSLAIARHSLAPVLQATTAESSVAWVVSGINAPASALVPIQPLGHKRPIFLIHSASGIVYSYYELARSLGRDRPVYALQDLSLEGQREPHQRIEDYAVEYMQVIRATQPIGPYIIGGWSFGGHVSIEIARRLKEIGETVALLIVIDSEAPVAGRSLSLAQHLTHAKNTLMEYIVGLPDIVPYIRDGLYLITEARSSLNDSSETRISPLEYLQYAWTDAMRRRLSRTAGIQQILARDSQLKRVPLPNSTVRRGLYIFRKHLAIVRHFEPKVYPGKITLLRAEEQIRRQYYTDATLGWGELVNEVDVRPVPGNHVSLFREPHVHRVAAVIRKCLEEVEAEYDGQRGS